MSKEFQDGKEAALLEARDDIEYGNILAGVPKDIEPAMHEEAEQKVAEQIKQRVEELGCVPGADFDPSVIDPCRVGVLDKGYVRLVDSMGSDLSVVNAARVSYDKESQEFDGKDDRLIRFLVRENHTAPFRHAILSFEAYAPLFVARQWWKHVIGSQQNLDPYLAWNESSRRYVTENEEFYLPSVWRSKPDNNKQGSGGAASAEVSANYTAFLEAHIEAGLSEYKNAMDDGVAPEMARLFLPANALYVRWRWTSSLQGVMHFIALRDEAHAQWEIVQYAKAVRELARTEFPVSIGALVDGA